MALTNSPTAAMSRAMALISKAKSKIVMGFSPLFVRLHWPDVNDAKPVLK